MEQQYDSKIYINGETQNQENCVKADLISCKYFKLVIFLFCLKYTLFENILFKEQIGYPLFFVCYWKIFTTIQLTNATCIW